MPDPLHVLVIEDAPSDYLLIERSLRQCGLAAQCHRVSSRAELAAALDAGPWHIVLADYTVPGVDFAECLGACQKRMPEVPVIVVSGTVGEERAVALLKRGVSDFVLKDRLLGLGPAVERSLAEASERRAKAALERELLLLHTAINAAADAVVITDRQGTITWVNPAFAELTGFSPEEAVGRNPRDLVNSGAHPQEYFAQLWDTILSGRVWRGDITNRRKDGHQYQEAQSITPVRDGTSAITHFVAIKHDLTAERQLQAQLLQAQKMDSIGRLAGGIAHDFNNLITAINATADLALLRLSADDPLRADLVGILQTGERAAALTRQLLAFSRKQVIQPSVLRIDAVVADMQHLLERVLGEDIELMVLTEPEGAWVMVDRGQFEQVILNLAVNGRDAMPHGGALTIEAAGIDIDAADAAAVPALHPGPHVVLSVGDTGTGMDAATQARIFEPFFTTKEPGRGTGLGLATVSGIVERSGGAIAVDSEPGRGTTVRIYLPRFQAPAPDATLLANPAAAQPHPPVKGTETLLLVEDEDVLRDLAARMLRVAGYAVIAAATGEEALAMLENEADPVHLALTDVMLPGMGGRELAERLGQCRPGIKVLYTSGYTDDVLLRKGLVNSAALFLEKPYTLESLTRKVREVLDSGS